MGNGKDDNDGNDDGNDDDDNNCDKDNNDDNAVFGRFNFAVFFDLPFLTFFHRHYNRGRWLAFLGSACLRRHFLLCFFSHGRLIDSVQVWDYVFFLVEEKNAKKTA